MEPRIKLIIWDLDGVLVDARELHYEALNAAIEEVIGTAYIISRTEHLSTYDGLPTTKKLKMLEQSKGVAECFHHKIWKTKQIATANIIDKMSVDNRVQKILSELKSLGYMQCVATNSIRETTKMMLLRRGFLEYINFFYSNQDVTNPKPNAEMYLRCMIKAQVNPNECLIIEDSHRGREAAQASGAYLLAVENSDGVSLDAVLERIRCIEKESIKRPKWQGGNMNVLIPMAGAGSRFEKAGYSFPKPLIDIGNKPMIQVVVENLNIEAKHIFVVQKEHALKYNLHAVLNLLAPGCDIIEINGVTEGAACTTLLAEELINNDNPLLIANSDQFIDWDSNEFLYAMAADGVDGGILTFESTHPKWSYAKLGTDGFVCEVAEKKPISNHATVGVYYWRQGKDYVRYANQMIAEDKRVNNEFYVCPVYNEAIADGARIRIWDVKQMWGLGTPEDLEAFLNDGVL